MKKRAVISVSNKTGIVEFARGLVEQGYELISTGGTYKNLEQAGVPVTYISQVTGFPEILDGRVKTLHPKIHGGILARDTEKHRQEMGLAEISFIDMVVVNLYPFKETISKSDVTYEEAIENIDIGGPTMVRAAAKNHERVAIVVNPERYGQVLAELREAGEISVELRKRLAAEAFAHTADYDRLIASYLEQQINPSEEFPSVLRLNAVKVQDLRYGENPSQKAAFYKNSDAGSGTLASGRQLQGKELSYNNWLDMDAAWSTVREFSDCAAVIIKHTNPCGVAIGKTPLEAYERALASDPVSAFGGILAFNRVIDSDCARALKERFYEVIVAPEFSPEAREILADKQNLRLVVISRGQINLNWKFKSVEGGYLVQEEDSGITPVEEWEVVTINKPTQEDLHELAFAWRVVKHVKSNAILISRNGQTLGVGAGQMNRVGSVKIALKQAGEKARGAYLASDAFFPFPDSLEAAAEAGIRAVVQPGGSVKDEAVIEAANKLGIIMLFTNRRHFLH